MRPGTRESSGDFPEFDRVDQPCLLVSPELVIIDANVAYLAATMTERDAILGRHTFDVFPDNPSDPNASGVRNLRASFKSVLEHRQPHWMPFQKYDVRGKDGAFEERIWDPLNLPVLGGDDRVRAICHLVQDITWRWRWRAFTLAEGIFARDPSLEWVLSNAASHVTASDRAIKSVRNSMAEHGCLIERSLAAISNSRRKLATH